LKKFGGQIEELCIVNIMICLQVIDQIMNIQEVLETLELYKNGRIR